MVTVQDGIDRMGLDVMDRWMHGCMVCMLGLDRHDRLQSIDRGSHSGRSIRPTRMRSKGDPFGLVRCDELESIDRRFPIDGLESVISTEP